MPNLLYITNTSLDGYIEDETGAFDWANSDQVFDVITGLMRPIGTILLGRRLYETMSHWDAPVADYPPEQRDFAQTWQKPKKLIFSRTLTAAPNTHVERDFNIDAIRKLKQESKDDIFIGGAELAALALEADLLDECHLFLHPVIVGAGKPALTTASRRNLDLIHTRRFDTGVIQAHYRIRSISAENPHVAPPC